MTNEHQITPPHGLVDEWFDRARRFPSTPLGVTRRVAEWAAQWGADKELEACCEWTTANFGELPGQNLHLYRRPKPPSLKKQACDALDAYVYGNPDHGNKQDTYNTIRRALEALPDD